MTEEQRYEDLALMAKAAKKAAIQLLGLNILPVEDAETGLLRVREDHEVIPLLAAICREDIAMEIKKRIEDLSAQELAKQELESEDRGEVVIPTAEDLDNFMNSDIEFMDDAEIHRRSVVNSPEYEYISKSVVQTLSADDRQKFTDIFGFVPDAAPEVLKEVLPKDGVKIDPEPVVVPQRRRLEIRIEPE